MRILVSILCFIVVFACSFSRCNAQIHGFMGKRFSVNVATYISPNIGRSDISSINSDNTGYLALNTRFSLGANYVLSNKWCIDAELHYLSTATQNLAFDDGIEPEGSKMRYSIVANSFSLKFQRFLTRKNDYIAPLGKYIALGAMATSFEMRDPLGNIFLTNSKLSSGNMYGAVIGLGKKRILFERIVLDYGAELLLYIYATKTSDITTKTSEFITIPQKRIRNASLINFKLSLGYLF